MAKDAVKIERMCYGGAGLARIEGKACFVPFSAPGDEARITVTKEKRSFMEGEVSELVVPGPCRVPPPCPIFGSCGGCQWQHLAYAEQLAQKGEIFADTLQRIGGVDKCVVRAPLASPHPYGYRSRIQVKVAWRGSKVLVGFFQGGTHDVVDTPTGCAIADPLLNMILEELRPVLARLPECRAVTQCELAMGDDGATIAILNAPAAAVTALAAKLAGEEAALPSVAGLFVRVGGKGELTRVFGIEELSYRVPEGFLPGLGAVVLRFGRGGFSQVNFAQNLQLIRTVWEWGAFTGKERVLDLFCGNGNFSLPLARYVAQIVGVEGFAPSVDYARKNARENGIDNASFHACDAAQALRRFRARGERFDVVVLDPPRAGAGCAAEIAALEPRSILYVSCDPPTLARDLGALAEQGYRVAKSQPVDMFPQTYHLESVTLLESCNADIKKS